MNVVGQIVAEAAVSVIRAPQNQWMDNEEDENTTEGSD